MNLMNEIYFECQLSDFFLSDLAISTLVSKKIPNPNFNEIFFFFLIVEAAQREKQLK